MNIFIKNFQKKIYIIGISEEIKINPENEYNKIFSFLGAKNIDIKKSLDTHIANYKNTIPKDLEIMLYIIYKSHNEKLYNILGRKIDVWENYYKTIN